MSGSGIAYAASHLLKPHYSLIVRFYRIGRWGGNYLLDCFPFTQI